MIRLTRRFRFSAAHRLENPDFTPDRARSIYGACGEDWHGHDYMLEISVAGTPDPQTGFLINAQELKQIVTRRLLERLDHRCLNTDVPFLHGVIPTMENLVVEFWKMLEMNLPGNARLERIRLYETADAWVDYPGPGKEFTATSGKVPADSL